jgi:hypothetical protein
MSKKTKMKLLQGADQPALLDKAASKMVEQVRLQNIEKENKSSGALLDTRTLHKLEEPKVGLNNKAKAKLDTQKRVESRRNARTEEELKKGSEQAINKMMAKGVDIVKTSNFENEELIWATKSSDPNYSKKRRFDDPELHAFKNSLSLEDRRMYKSLCHQALVDLATKYREEIEEIRSDMDLAGIFHPDANTHRAHCMYLMKLYGGIRADTIEDPILRKIRADGLAKKLKQEEEEKRQRDLIASFENKKGKKEKKVAVGVAETMALANAEEEEKKKVLEDQQATELERLRAKEQEAVKEAEVEKNRRASRKTKSEKPQKVKAKIVQPALKKSKTLPTLSPAAAATASTKKPQDKENGATITPEEASVDSTVSEAPSDKGMAANDAKLFTKMKRGKMGGVDPRTLLHNEASRLDDAEVSSVKKMKERSTLVDQKTSTWMLQLLQESQIDKSASGRELAPAVAGLMPSDTFGDTINSPNKNSHMKEDPQRVIPFEEFYDMFKTYSENTTADEALRALATEVDERAIPQDPKDGWEPRENDFGSKVGLEDSSPGSLDLASMPSTVIDKFEPTDTLKELAEVDPHFEAYMKMERRKQPQGQRLFRGKVNKQSKRRPHNPLGQLAVHMTDSKGNATMESSKGFTNVFNMSMADGDSSSEEDEPENAFLAGGNDDDDNSLENEGDTNSPTHTSERPDTPNDGTPNATVTIAATVQRSQLGSPTHRTSRPGSRGKRGRSREGGARGGTLAGEEAEDGKDLQAKLMVAFDCLQTPALSRLTFMRKYAQVDKACDFNAAIDRVAESAILALAREELVHKNKVKLHEGFAVLPLVASNLLKNFTENIPPLLNSRAPALCVMKSYSDQLTDPASVVALQSVNKLVHQIFPDDRSNDLHDNAMTPETAEELLSELEAIIENMLNNLDDKIFEEGHDRIHVQGKALKDWLKKFNKGAPKEEKKE